MKTLLILLLSITATAQITNIDTTGKDQYINIRFEAKTGNLLSNKISDYTVFINMGAATKGEYHKYQNASGKAITFKGYVAVLNHLYKNGWIMFNRRESTSFSNTDIVLQKNN